jgi:hypothetical protein
VRAFLFVPLYVFTHDTFGTQGQALLRGLAGRMDREILNNNVDGNSGVGLDGLMTVRPCIWRHTRFDNL